MRAHVAPRGALTVPVSDLAPSHHGGGQTQRLHPGTACPEKLLLTQNMSVQCSPWDWVLAGSHQGSRLLGKEADPDEGLQRSSTRPYVRVRMMCADGWRLEVIDFWEG